ncbi:MAG TPA: polysaccharide biosynthesis/export family protein [Terriglobales bacterium]|nr:polysaccharide biosynthesis/export family protein [Terriglobales bacterium]
MPISRSTALSAYCAAWLLLLGWACLNPSLLRAQAAATSAAENPQLTTLPPPPLALPNNAVADLVAPAAPDSYLIGDTDLLSVFVYQMPELTRQLRVSADGTITLPFLRKPFRAAGNTAPQLQRLIADELVSEGLARSPAVQVVVVQVESKPVVVSGAVKNPTTIQAARPLRMLEVLARAGGLGDQAGDQVIVSSSEGVTSYSLDRLLTVHAADSDPLLVGGETVTVVPAKQIYVVGAFVKPGAFPLRMGEPIGVIQAIALAQGMKSTPNRRNSEIIRTLDDGSRRELPVNLDRILDHKAPNPLLQAGDILYVPEDGKRAALNTALLDLGQLITLGAAYRFP